MEKTNNSLSFVELGLWMLFLLFLGLKLGNVIDWAWIWVFAPLWIPAGIFLLIILGAVIYAMTKKDDK